MTHGLGSTSKLSSALTLNFSPQATPDNPTVTISSVLEANLQEHQLSDDQVYANLWTAFEAQIFSLGGYGRFVLTIFLTRCTCSIRMHHLGCMREWLKAFRYSAALISSGAPLHFHELAGLYLTRGEKRWVTSPYVAVARKMCCFCFCHCGNSAFLCCDLDAEITSRHLQRSCGHVQNITFSLTPP